ncbi:hypothetical protein Tco_0859150 [Tanacetum coccineum]|uniref:Uncharacterized protein n=1 Tax=Tanacetum coccineum TaxID=301880 RepID=A0ABQ5BF41_9ASTR
MGVLQRRCNPAGVMHLIELCSAGYKDAPGSVSSFLSSFCISVGTSGLNDLELKLTDSKYERQQLIEEATILKDKMLKTLNLENEVCDYKRKLDKLKSENSNLEASLRSVSSSFEELKAEKILFAKEMSEYGNCKNKKSALEEKLMRLVSDLMDGTRLQEYFYVLLSFDATWHSAFPFTGDEITENYHGSDWIRSANLKHQLRIQQLEGKKNEYLKKMEDLKLQLAKSKTGANETRSQEDIDYAAKVEMLEAELDEAIDANKKYRLHEVNCWFAESVHEEDGMKLFIRTKKFLELWPPFSVHIEQNLLFDSSLAVTSSLGLNLEKDLDTEQSLFFDSSLAVTSSLGLNLEKHLAPLVLL